MSKTSIMKLLSQLLTLLANYYFWQQTISVSFWDGFDRVGLLCLWKVCDTQNCLQWLLGGLDCCIKTAYSRFQRVGDDCLLLPHKRPFRHHPPRLYFTYILYHKNVDMSNDLMTVFKYFLFFCLGLDIAFKPQILYRAL